MSIGLCRSAPALGLRVPIPAEGAFAGRRALRCYGLPGSTAEGTTGCVLRAARPAGSRRSAHRASLQTRRNARHIRQTLRARRHTRRQGRQVRLGHRPGGGEVKATSRGRCIEGPA